LLEVYLSARAIEESRKSGLKVIILHVFANNNRAKLVYEKAGFRKTGRIPKGIHRNNKYVDDIIMTLAL
jgi:RimJ/RimL family protein N-acetyltransferase